MDIPGVSSHPRPDFTTSREIFLSLGKKKILILMEVPLLKLRAVGMYQ